MQGEKEIAEYYEGKLLGNNNGCPLSLRILTTLQICTEKEMLPIDRAQWFAILFGELEKVPPVEINQPIYHIYNIYMILIRIILFMVMFLLLGRIKIKTGILDTLIGFQKELIIHFIQKSEIRVKKIRVCMK